MDGVRDQILFDGLFHAAMYVVPVVGLAGLVRDRSVFGEARSDRWLVGAASIGFGVWHVLDAVLSHWILGIHRIKLDSAHPLVWDLGWFVVFGIGPILLGWRPVRGGRDGPSDRYAALGITVAVMVGGAWAARPPTDSDTAIVLFQPGMSEGEAINAILAADGRLLWQSRGVWAVRWKGTPRSELLYPHGAWFVSTTLGGAGCLAWSGR